MKKKLISVMLAGLVAAISLFSTAKTTYAATASVVSVTPAVVDISASMTGLPDGVEGFLFIPTVTTEGTTYTAVFSVSEEPLTVVTVGGQIVDNWTYDAATQQVTVVMTYSGQIMDPTGILQDAMSVGISFSSGADGIPAEASGVWMSTNLLNWMIVPPTQDNPQFGFELSGPEGYNGYFQMFLPDSLIALLSQLQGKTLTADDLAVFIDNSQASVDVSTVTGGVLIDINITFDSGNTSISPASTQTVTKSVSTGSKLPISLSAKKASVSKGVSAKLYGWIKSGLAGKTVTVWEKKTGASTFTKMATVTTKADGYYSYSYKAKKSSTWKAKWKKTTTSKAKVSPNVSVTVN
ncbi:MAG: hypothetical protein WCV88_05990 [Patescibacteria group bacterium]